MVEFLWKFENRGIKIAQGNWIRITESINLLSFILILYCVGGRCDVDVFKLTASAQSIYREVSDIIYTYSLHISQLGACVSSLLI